MVLDDVTFARIVVEGKVNTVTVTVVDSGEAASAPGGERVTAQNARAGLRVRRGPDWAAGDSDGGPGGCGKLTRPVPDSAGQLWHVQWDKDGSDVNGWNYRAGKDGKHSLVFCGAKSFAWASAGTPRICVKYVSSGVAETFELEGDAETRVTKMAAWLPQNGLAQSGGAKDAMVDGRWVRTLVFTRADLPF
jgi:hypothetical protein